MRYISTTSAFLVALLASVAISTSLIFAAFPSSSPTPTSSPTPIAVTQNSEPALGQLELILKEQKLGSVWPMNPIKYAIRSAVSAGVPANTLALLLLLPLIASVIAATRHLVGLRGFGIFLPAALIGSLRGDGSNIRYRAVPHHRFGFDDNAHNLA